MGRYEQIEVNARSSHNDCATALMQSAYASDCKAFKRPAPSGFQFDGLEGLNGSTREIPRYISNAASQVPKFLAKSWDDTCQSLETMPADQKAGWVAIGVISIGLMVASRGKVNPVALQHRIPH